MGYIKLQWEPHAGGQPLLKWNRNFQFWRNETESLVFSKNCRGTDMFIILQDFGPFPISQNMNTSYKDVIVTFLNYIITRAATDRSNIRMVVTPRQLLCLINGIVILSHYLTQHVARTTHSGPHSSWLVCHPNVFHDFIIYIYTMIRHHT